MLQVIPNLTWKSRVTEHFNFTREVKAQKEIAGEEILSHTHTQFPHENNTVIQLLMDPRVTEGQQNLKMGNFAKELMKYV